MTALEQETAPGPRWSREWIVEAILAWRERTNVWPTAEEWAAETGQHPSAATVEAEFGSFWLALRAARSAAAAMPSARKADVPTEPLARAVEAWLAEDPFVIEADKGAGVGRTRTLFAELAGIDPSRLQRILRPRRFVTRRVADRILDTADLAYLWHVDPDLRAVLEGGA